MKLIQRLLTITQIAIHAPGSSPVFGEGTLFVEVADDAAGPFVAISQNGSGDPEYAGKICLDYDTDWPALAQAVQMLMQQPGVQEPLQ